MIEADEEIVLNGEPEYYYDLEVDWEGGYSVRKKDGEIIALCFDKNYAIILAELLNKYANDYKIIKNRDELTKAEKIKMGMIYHLGDLILSKENRLKRYMYFESKEKHQKEFV